MKNRNLHNIKKYLSPKFWLVGVLLLVGIVSNAQHWEARVYENNRLIEQYTTKNRLVHTSNNPYDGYAFRISKYYGNAFSQSLLNQITTNRNIVVEYTFIHPNMNGNVVSFDIQADDGFVVFTGDLSGNQLSTPQSSNIIENKSTWALSGGKFFNIIATVPQGKYLKILWSNATLGGYFIEVENFLYLKRASGGSLDNSQTQINQLFEVEAYNHNRGNSSAASPSHGNPVPVVTNYTWFFRKEGESNWRHINLGTSYGHLKLTGANDAVVPQYYNNSSGTYEYYLQVTMQKKGQTHTEKSEIKRTRVLCPTLAVNISDVHTNGRICRLGNNRDSNTISVQASGGVPPYTITYKINNGAEQSVTQTGAGATTIPKPNPAKAEHQLQLVSVTDSQGCTTPLTQQAIINAELDAGIYADTYLCTHPNPNETPVRIGIIGGIPPYTITYKIVEGNDLQTGNVLVESTVTENNAGQVPLSLIHTNIPNPPLSSYPIGARYTYKLSVRDGMGCFFDVYNIKTIEVAEVDASFVNHTNGTYCNRTPRIEVTGSYKPFVVEYSVDGGAIQTITMGENDSNGYNLPLANTRKVQEFRIHSVKAKGCDIKNLDKRAIYVPAIEGGTWLMLPAGSTQNNPDEVNICLGQTDKPYVELRVYDVTNVTELDIRYNQVINGVSQNIDQHVSQNDIVSYGGERTDPSSNRKYIVVKRFYPPDQVGSYQYSLRGVTIHGCHKTFGVNKMMRVHNPSHILGLQDVNFCLPTIRSANFDSTTNGFVILNNGYIFQRGNTSLDLPNGSIHTTPCCQNPTKKWKIDGLVSEQIGNPSAYNGTITFTNDTSTDRIYTITYWLECPSGVKSQETTRNIVVSPRPVIDFQ